MSQKHFLRHRIMRAVLLAGVSAISISSAHAQTATTAASTTSGNAAGSNATLPPIIVAAQRRQENIQKVPAAIISVSGKALQNSGYREVTDLQYMTPGLEYDPANGSAFQLRGVGSESFDFSNEKSVSVVVDDVVQDGQRDNGLLGFQDIQRVDVLYGPQGTLFGKNSTSGVIAVTTNDPVLNKTSASVYASYGQRLDHDLSAIVNAPAGDKVAVRISAFDNGQLGYGDYTDFPGKKENTFREYGYRAKLLVQPTPELSVIFTNDYENHWDNGVRLPVGGASAAVTKFELQDGVTPSATNPSTADFMEGMIKTSSLGDSLRIKYHLPNDDTIDSITAFRATTYDNNTPVDLVHANQYAYLPFNYGDTNTSKFSQELRLASPTSGFLEYLAGLYFDKLDAHQTQYQMGTLGAPLFNAAGVEATTLYTTQGAASVPGSDEDNFRTDNTSAAAFGQLKFNFTDQLSLALGSRLTYDHNRQSLGFLSVPTAPITGASDRFIYLNGTPYRSSGSVQGRNASFRVSPEYNITPDSMLYVTYATGYKPGGVAFVSNRYDPYRAETVQDFELGEKSEFFDHRLRVDADLFDEQFKNFQASTVQTIPGVQPINVIAVGNAKGLISEGAEASVALRPISALLLNGSLTYANTYFTNFAAGLPSSTTPGLNYRGEQLSNAPRWTADISAQYDSLVTDQLMLHASTDISYRSALFAQNGEPEYAKVDGYALVNGRLSLSPANNPLQFGLYVRNLFGTYFSSSFQNYGAPGILHYTTPDAYRTVGVFLQDSF